MPNLRWKVITVLAVFVVFSALGVYPIVAERYGINQPAWLMAKRLKLGLDLKGGVHLVLRVKTDDALRLQTEQDSERLREALSKAAITATITTPDSTHIRVEGVPPAQDAAFRSAAADIQTDFDRSAGTGGIYTFTMKPNIQVTLREEAVDQSRQTIERRVNELGVTEPSIAQQGQGGDQILVQLPGVTDVDKAKGIIQQTGLLELKIVEQGPAATRESLLVNGQVAAGMEIVPGAPSPGDPGGGTVYYLVRKAAAVAGKDLRNARPTIDENNQPAVSFTLNNDGAARFAQGDRPRTSAASSPSSSTAGCSRRRGSNRESPPTDGSPAASRRKKSRTCR